LKQLVIGDKRDGDFFFIDSVRNGFVPSTRQNVFDAIKGKEIRECPFVNLPEKKGAHRMDGEKMASVRWMHRALSPKLRLTSEYRTVICGSQNFSRPIYGQGMKDV